MKTLEQWIEFNKSELPESYFEHVNNMQDSIAHKQYMLNNEKCFIEWCEEIYEKQK